MIDFADLSIRTDYSSVDKATASLDKLAAASAKAEQSTGRVGVASISATRGMGAWSALNAEAAGRVGEHSLNISRLERVLASSTERALGLNSTLGLLGATALKFGVGDIYTVAIVGGIYAIVQAWDILTKSAREAAKAQEEGINSALKMLQMKGAGPGGSATIEYGQESARMISLQSQKASLEANMATRGELGAYGSLIKKYSDNPKLVDLNEQIADLADVMKATKREMDKANLAENTRTLGEAMRKQEEAHRKAEAALAKQREEDARYQELVRSTSFSPLSLDYARTRAGSVGSTFSPPAMNDREQSAFNDSIGKPLQDEIKTASDRSVHEAVAAYKEGTGKWIDDASKNAKKTQEAIWAAAQASANTIVNALNIGGGGRGSGIGGALGQAGGGAAGYLLGAGGGTLGFLGGPAGAIVGATVGGILGSLVGGLFDHGKAVREAAKAQRNINLELDQIAAGLSHNKLASALLAIEANLASTIASFNAALPGTRNEGQRNADIAQAKAYAEQQKQQAAAQIAADNKYASEDLAVRNLKALGHTDEANLVAFKEAQQRELAQAILDGRDATYQNNLVTTQNNELIAYQNGLLATALRNAPTGFYGAAAYIGQYATPRSADPFGTGMPAPNSPLGPDPTGGLTPPGGSRGRPPLPTTQTIILTVDGKVLTRAVVNNLDQTAAATAGAGSSRSDALNVH